MRSSICRPFLAISIHALRVEGDGCRRSKMGKSCYFYPRPPGGGRPRSTETDCVPAHFYPRPPGGGRLLRPVSGATYSEISIHALRVEGDHCCREYGIYVSGISIHALRVEGDTCTSFISSTSESFLSTPSGWRATLVFLGVFLEHHAISIHALRVEGDTSSCNTGSRRMRFLSTPSGWRATAASAARDLDQ